MGWGMGVVDGMRAATAAALLCTPGSCAWTPPAGAAGLRRSPCICCSAAPRLPAAAGTPAETELRTWNVCRHRELRFAGMFVKAKKRRGTK